MKKILLGIFISCVLLYFSFKGISLKGLENSFNQADFFFLIPVLFLSVLTSFLRSLRWGIILSGISHVPQRVLFPIHNVGHMMIIFLPARLGELVRPYLVSRSTSITMTSAVTTIVVERVLDLLILFFLFCIAIITSEVPDWFINAGYSLLIIISLLFVFLLLFYFGKFYKSHQILSKLPSNFRKKLESLFFSFKKGVSIFSDFHRFGLAALISVMIWLSALAIVYSLYLFQGLDLPLISTVVLLLVVALGVSIPNAPGFIGSFQFACVVGLSIYNVPKTDAVAFSIVYYLFSIGFFVIIGAFFLPFVDFSIKQLKSLKWKKNTGIDNK